MPASAPESATRTREMQLHRRWWFWAVVVPLAAMILPVLAHRGLLEYRCAQIRKAGGSVSVGSPPIYRALDQNDRQSAFWRRVPRPVRMLCRSRPVAWCFNQFPAVYGVYLRGERDPQNVDVVLSAAKCFPHLHRLTLYQSAAGDQHLEGLAASCPRLTHLVINETAVTDRGMLELHGLRRLELVNAQRTAITDASVPILADLPRLKELAVAETGITSVDLIRQRRPLCKIHTRLKVATPCPRCRWPLNECRCSTQHPGKTSNPSMLPAHN